MIIVNEREVKAMANTIYTVIRVDKWEEFKTIQTHIHIYSFQTSNKEKVLEYARKIKKTYPDRKVAVVNREKAKELQKKCYQMRKECERKALAELDKKSKDILLRQTVYSAFAR